MKNEFAKLKQIVADYRQAVQNYRKEQKNIVDTYSSSEASQRLQMAKEAMENAVDSFKAEYKQAYNNAIEAARVHESNPQFATDQGFQNVIATLKTAKGTLEPAVVRGMIAPYKADYTARKVLASVLKEMGGKTDLYDIGTDSPYLALKEIDGKDVFEFNNWERDNNYNAGMDLSSQLNRIENIVDGNAVKAEGFNELII